MKIKFFVAITNIANLESMICFLNLMSTSCSYDHISCIHNLDHFRDIYIGAA